MKKFFGFLVFIISMAAAQPTVNPFGKNIIVNPSGKNMLVVNSNYYTYELDKDYSATSAGVYTKADNRLVRTLFSGKKETAGKKTVVWDGTDDFHRPVSRDSAYYIKVLAANITSTWNTIGNNSLDATGPRKYQSFQFMTCLTFRDGRGIFSIGYNEAQGTGFYFNQNEPNRRFVLINNTFKISAIAVATDGEKTYWMNELYGDENQNKYCLIATYNGTANRYVFPQGTMRRPNHSNYDESVLDYYPGLAYGLAVQQIGNYLITGRLNGNINVYNKHTGQLIHSQVTPGVVQVALQGEDILWATMGTTGQVIKYQLNANGTLTQLADIQGFEKPSAIAVSPDGTKLSVGDRKRHTVKHFSTANMQLLSEVGEPYSYFASGPLVNDYKFLFNDVDGNQFITYQPDGSYWVNDHRNFRVQHFDANNQFINNIQFQENMYNLSVDKNNPARVFGNCLEWEIDYSKPLAPNNGSWKLKRNWQPWLSGHDGQYRNAKNTYYTSFREVYTLSNGRTYGTTRHPLGEDRTRMYELTDTGLRHCQTYEDLNLNQYQSYYYYPTGELRGFTYPNADAGGNVPYYRFLLRSFSGFNSNNDPLWEPPTQVASCTQFGGIYPTLYTRLNVNWEMDSDSIIYMFQSSAPTDTSATKNQQAYHAGGVKWGESKFKYLFARGTGRDYWGWAPTNGWFDEGNGTQRAGAVLLTLDSFVAFVVVQEFFQGPGQSNYEHITKDGLYIGSVGTDAMVAKTTGGTTDTAAYMLAGNAFNPAFVKYNGRYFIYWQDEGAHSAVHRAEVFGLNDVKQFVSDKILIRYEPKEPYVAGTSMLSRLKFAGVNSRFLNGEAGINYSYNPSNLNGFSIYKNRFQYDSRKPSSLYVVVDDPRINATIDIPFFLPEQPGDWSIELPIMYLLNKADRHFISILDNDDKEIFRWYIKGYTQSPYPDHWGLEINETLLHEPEERKPLMETYMASKPDASIKFSKRAGKLYGYYTKYAEIEVPNFSGANTNRPTKMVIGFQSSGDSYTYHIFDLIDVVFNGKVR